MLKIDVIRVIKKLNTKLWKRVGGGWSFGETKTTKSIGREFRQEDFSAKASKKTCLSTLLKRP